jgi:RNA polymerase sigma-70 factor (ECF subfamily)
MGDRFMTTRWSVVLAAGRTGEPAAREALSTLCGLYWRPLYAFLRRRGLPPEEAEDMTQAFLVHVIEKESISHVDPHKGKFRSFLLISLKNFLSDQRSKEAALKRGGGVAPVSLDADEAEGRYRLETADDLTPERIFERQWALTVIEQAMSRLRERYEKSGKAAHFDEMKTFLSGEKRPVPHAEVAERLGITPLAVKVAVHRLRKRFRDALREEIAQTVATPDEIDSELQALYAALEG